MVGGGKELATDHHTIYSLLLQQELLLCLRMWTALILDCLWHPPSYALLKITLSLDSSQ